MSQKNVPSTPGGQQQIAAYTTYVVVHGIWYALDAGGALVSGPLLTSGVPQFADGRAVNFSVLSKDAHVAISEIERLLRWFRTIGVERALRP